MQRSGVKLCGAVLGVIVFLPGCALTTANLDLEYRPEPGKKSPLSTIQPMSFALMVEDQRSANEKDRVGDKKNNYGWVTARILSKKEPTLVLKEALTKELKNNGHKVVKDSGESDVTIEVRLKKYWSDARIHFWDVEMIATLNTELSILISKGESAATTKPITCTFRDSTPIATDGQHQNVLNGALAEFVRSFSRDPTILEAIKRARGKK